MTHAHSLASDADEAVREVASNLSGEPLACVLFFCSPSYDLGRLGAALRRSFVAPVIACTSAGQLGASGFQRGGVTAVGLASDELVVRSYAIRSLDRCEDAAAGVATEVLRDRKGDPPASRAFGLILVDGLATAEEQLTAALYGALGDFPVIGGSAADDLAFAATHVYIDGEFVEAAAVFTVFATTLPFTTFKFQQVVASDKRVVITAADPDTRTIFEIDGEPAAQVYAELIGVPLALLSMTKLNRHPLVYSLDGEPYVRSIARVNPDLSMTLFCAIEVGLVLSIGDTVDPEEPLARAFAGVNARIGKPAVVIGCDCILRRLELERDGKDAKIGELLGRENVIGFSTYGEQWNGLHVNQTFTGVAIGA